MAAYEAARQSAVETIEREFGAVGVLVNNAGYGSYGALEDVPIAEARRQVAGQRLGSQVVLLPPTGLAPDFEMGTHADQIDGFLELGVFAQLRRNQDAPGRIRLLGARIADQHALDRRRPRIEAGCLEDLVTDRLPGRRRVEQQAAMGVRRQDERTLAGGEQGLEHPFRRQLQFFRGFQAIGCGLGVVCVAVYLMRRTGFFQ